MYLFDEIKNFAVLLTSKCESQEIEENYWSSNTTDESSESLFEVTGYPMTGDVPILNRKVTILIFDICLNLPPPGNMRELCAN